MTRVTKILPSLAVGALLIAALLASGTTSAVAATDSSIVTVASPRSDWVGRGDRQAVGAITTPSPAARGWTFIESSTFPGTYVIRQRDPLGGRAYLYLDLNRNSVADGTQLVTARFDGSPSQHWLLEKHADINTRYRLKNRFSKRYVTFGAASGSAPLLLEVPQAGEQQWFDAAPDL